MRFLFINEDGDIQKRNENFSLETIQTCLGEICYEMPILSNQPLVILVRDDFFSYKENETANKYVDDIGVKIPFLLKGPVLITGLNKEKKLTDLIGDIPENYIL